MYSPTVQVQGAVNSPVTVLFREDQDFDYYIAAAGGFRADADREMIPGGRMGMSNMWMWHQTDEVQKFPETPWAVELTEKDFPYPNRFHAQWFWESGFDKDPLKDLELIRDWNLRASYGAWDAIKNEDPSALQRAAHTLKGSVRVFGAERAASAALRIEKLGGDENLAGAQEALAELAEEIDKLMPMLNELVKS